MSRHWILLSLAAGAACFAALAVLNNAACRQSEEKMGTAPVGKAAAASTNEELVIKLGGPNRYLTFLSTDKPIYRSGENVYVRGVLLNAKDHKPLASSESANATIEIRGPKGDVVAGGTVAAQDSVWGFSWQVPEQQAGGQYQIEVTYPWNGHAPAQRKFDIRAYRPPRLKSQITFMRDGYGPGEKVNATLDVKRAEGGVPEGARVSVQAMLDGIEIKGETAKVGPDGLCSVSFDLPEDIARGEGTLALIIEDGGVVETASKTIPILLQTVDLQVYPEGGDLVAGVKNRVYVQAKQPNGKPADLFAELKCKQDELSGSLNSFKTEHEGRGKFEFVPEAGKEYYLAIKEPRGIKTKFELPEVKAQGAVLRADQEVYQAGKPVNLHVACTEKNYRVSIARQEQELAAQTVENGSRKNQLDQLSFELPEDADGVLRVTVFDQRNRPLAERLIYRQAANQLKVTISTDKENYIPGEEVKLKIKAADSKGKPAAAVLGITVTDDSVLEMVEKREQAPNLPVMVFLEPEVDDLADAHVYFDQKNPKSQAALDLLLATQGWRRFALVDLEKFVKEHGDKARRAVAMRIQSQHEQEEAQKLAQANFENLGAMAGAMLAKNEAPGAVAPNSPRALPVNAAAAPMAAPRVKGDGNAAAPSPSPSPLRQQAMQPIDQLGDAADFREVQADKDTNADKELAAFAQQAGRHQQAAGLESAIAFAAEKKRASRIAADEKQLSGQLSNLVYVREYAHRLRPNRKSGDRVDFTETVYWSAGVKTDKDSGEATVSFALNDSVSTFRVNADAFTTNGSLANANIGVESVQPFYAEAKLPLEVTAGDQIMLPISLVNATSSALSDASAALDLKGEFKLGDLHGTSANTQLAAGERRRLLQTINVGPGNSKSAFILNCKAGAFQDKVTRELSVKPKGFPVEVAFGGMIEPGQKLTHIITIPEQVLPESVSSNTGVYPTPLANMTEALERMIQDPYGCFEQTSSTSYPLTMAQQYFLSHSGINPELVEKSRQKLDAGYKRLVSFWCPDRGYEWFGENPGHEALTAFGLLHFSDMSQVKDVDQAMISTTRDWLLKQKDGSGGFTRKRRSLHTWTDDKDCSDAYIVWSLLESGQPAADLKAELASLKTRAAVSKDSYMLALTANALHLAGEKEEAVKLMEKLAAKQKSDGSVDAVLHSVVGSGGESLQVEGSSLATLAWLRDPRFAGNVERSVKYLADSCKAGRYGSTQATVLALRAIVNYDKSRSRPKAAGRVRVYVDGQAVGDWQDFTPQTQGAIKLPDISELLSPGQHKLELAMEGGGSMPYSMAVKYNTITPNSSKDCKLDLQVELAQNKLAEGAATEAKVKIRNKSKEGVPTPIAIIGLPGGLEARHDQLKELVKKGQIDAYEVLGRELVLYWRALGPEAKVELPLSLIAAIPGKYTGPASRAYLYYTDEHKTWLDGLSVEISAK